MPPFRARSHPEGSGKAQPGMVNTRSSKPDQAGGQDAGSPSGEVGDDGADADTYGSVSANANAGAGLDPQAAMFQVVAAHGLRSKREYP